MVLVAALAAANNTAIEVNQERFMTDPQKEQHLEQLRRETDRYVLQAHGSTLGAHAQMWLTLARALDAAGVLSADALAQQLERHAQRAPEDPGWFYTLLEVAQLLREPSSNHPDSRLR